MAKKKKKLTAAQKAKKKRDRELYEWIFINGKQKRVKRQPEYIDPYEIDDPIFLHQNGMYEELHAWEMRRDGIDESGGEERSSEEITEDDVSSGCCVDSKEQLFSNGIANKLRF